ncbi:MULTISPECIES: PFGI-1 class ICE element type IV pilus protein PilL2 [Halomonadaceae]|uniref:PFGI-1 class ICE element type IV pilus protein PilL2 n=1 Tax=Halomonadaceae TaxID=28256 RepID=UPI00068A68C1|nr:MULTISPECIES: PilL N-terminal domain-containing protein [Halomonadaceae]MDF9434658.1 PilL N-terminal domain-containing protein [Chromohalobacter israelensis]
MMHAFPRFLSCGVAMVLLAGCAHQPPVNTGTTSKVDAASALQISPLDEPEVITTEHQVVTGPNPPHRGIVDPDVYDQELIPVEVLRTGRYQLVTMQAPMGQRHLLEQIVNVHIPPSISTTVGDGIRYTLKNTGYTLCPATRDHQKWLYSRQLPAAHYHLGPMTLREALQVLAGDAWELEEDPVRRQVCYEQRDLRTVETTTVVPERSHE